jgi:hypothetical protein
MRSQCSTICEAYEDLKALTFHAHEVIKWQRQYLDIYRYEIKFVNAILDTQDTDREREFAKKLAEIKRQKDEKYDELRMKKGLGDGGEKAIEELRVLRPKFEKVRVEAASLRKKIVNVQATLVKDQAELAKKTGEVTILKSHVDKFQAFSKKKNNTSKMSKTSKASHVHAMLLSSKRKFKAFSRNSKTKHLSLISGLRSAPVSWSKREFHWDWRKRGTSEAISSTKEMLQLTAEMGLRILLFSGLAASLRNLRILSTSCTEALCLKILLNSRKTGDQRSPRRSISKLRSTASAFITVPANVTSRRYMKSSK